MILESIPVCPYLNELISVLTIRPHELQIEIRDQRCDRPLVIDNSILAYE